MSTMPVEAKAIATVAGDTVAVIGTNHKTVLFPLEQVPEMARGCKKHSGGKLSNWRGNRADAGRLAHGLPKSNKFNRGVE